MQKFVSALCLAVAFCSGLLAEEQTNASACRFDAIFQKGDTVAFLGDSITHGGEYHILLQAFFKFRYPELDLWTENLGRSGDTSWGALEQRLDGDLWRVDPDVVFLHFGMNDVGRSDFKDRQEAPSDTERRERRNRYATAMKSLIDAVGNRVEHIVILSPTHFDDGLDRWDNRYESPHLNAELGLFAKMGQDLARERQIPFVDLHTPLTRLTNQQQEDDPTFSFTVDRVHPRRGGERIMAWTILTSLGADPLVYDMHISAEGDAKVEHASGADIGELRREQAVLTWTSQEANLPFPVTDSALDRAFDLVSFHEDLNRMKLRVSGLAPGSYHLSIEGQNVAEFTATDLQAGVNLALLTTTPQYQTAAGILNGLLKEKRDIQATLRHLNSFRLSLLAMAKDYPEILQIDWEHPDAELANRIRGLDVERKKAAGRNTGAWYGFITSQGKQHLQDLPKMRRRLQELRSQLEALPETRTYEYRLVKLQDGPN